MIFNVSRKYSFHKINMAQSQKKNMTENYLECVFMTMKEKTKKKDESKCMGLPVASYRTGEAIRGFPFSLGQNVEPAEGYLCVFQGAPRLLNLTMVRSGQVN